MESSKYFILVGALLLVMALIPGILKKIPITSSIIYLLFGLFLGRHGLNLFGTNISSHKKLIEVISEITVIISLFTVGLKLRLPLRNKKWLLPLSLASVSMILSITLLALSAYALTDLSPGLAILLGAILAPTDPVLASEVQLTSPKDQNILKFSLTAEGGLNDGTAFPFVMLGLGLIGNDGQDFELLKWFTKDLLWSVTVGIAIGAASGLIISKLANFVSERAKSFYLEDFLTIASISLSYGLAIKCGAYGFLSVFANALTIRQKELTDTGIIHKLFKRDLPDDVLSFNEQLERIFEVLSVVIVGLLVDLNTFTKNYAILAAVLFVIIRPMTIFAGTFMTKEMDFREKAFLSWFGVRGIGSIYYLFYSLNHGAQGVDQLIHYTLWIVFFSILIHGFSVKPLMKSSLYVKENFEL